MVEQHDQDFLVVEVFHAWAQVTIGVVAARDFEPLLKFFLLVTARQFQCGKYLDGLDLADAVIVLHQVVDALAGDEVEFVIVVAQDALAQVNNRLARRAHAQQDGEQLGGREAAKAVLLGLFARAVLLGDRVLDVARPRQLVVFFLFHHGLTGLAG